MKKNLLSIIILALLIINLIMSGFMMLSVLSTNSQTAKIISDIAGALELEANGGNTGGFSGSQSGVVAVTDVATFGFTGDDNLTINLKSGSDGKPHYLVIDVVFSMNTASPDYATLGAEDRLASMRELVKSKINNVLASYTMEELQSGALETARETILEEVQELFGSNFIFDCNFSSVVYA
ncbi:MAG: flagellar basal body-associated FliL family protein [Butyrivibrio sp.]|nr:flagellar basal body-associated FliL family protein [Butyrivibrio sp.]